MTEAPQGTLQIGFSLSRGPKSTTGQRGAPRAVLAWGPVAVGRAVDRVLPVPVLTHVELSAR